jgi:uncharacterized protein (TIGR03083 family)
MMAKDVGPLERALTESVEVFGSLSADEMEAPSACAGWTVRTLLAHLTGGVAGMAGLLSLGGYAETDDLEEVTDARARQLAARPAAELLELLRLSVPKVLATFGALPPQYATAQVSLGSAGAYPFARMADALTFDHTCHVRWDLLAPRGPVRRVLPELDEGRLASSVSWLVGGIPRMTTAGFRAALTEPLAFVLTGPGATTFRVLPGADTAVVATGALPPGSQAARAAVRSTAADFVAWGTGREPRHGRVAVDGDAAYADRVLDAFRVY